MQDCHYESLNHHIFQESKHHSHKTSKAGFGCFAIRVDHTHAVRAEFIQNGSGIGGLYLKQCSLHDLEELKCGCIAMMVTD